MCVYSILYSMCADMSACACLSEHISQWSRNVFIFADRKILDYPKLTDGVGRHFIWGFGNHWLDMSRLVIAYGFTLLNAMCDEWTDFMRLKLT